MTRGTLKVCLLSKGDGIRAGILGMGGLVSDNRRNPEKRINVKG